MNVLILSLFRSYSELKIKLYIIKKGICSKNSSLDENLKSFQYYLKTIFLSELNTWSP